VGACSLRGNHGGDERVAGIDCASVSSSLANADNVSLMVRRVEEALVLTRHNLHGKRDI
jgi:hypothetical protein